MNYINDRSNAPVTLFKGCLNDEKPKGVATISQILAFIRDDSNKDLIAFSERLKALKRTNGNQYKNLKEKDCPAFIIGEFSERKNEACQQYAPLMAFDIDHSGPEFAVLENLQRLAANPYVYAAFTSPSGEGLRFLVWCDCDQVNHKVYYQKVADYFSQAINIPTDKALRKQWKGVGLEVKQVNEKLKQTEHIDTSTNNLARLWFYTWVPEELFFMNAHSSVFYLKEATSRAENGRQQAQPMASNPEPLTEDTKVSICLEKVNRQQIAGGRNNFVFAFACELARHGVNQVRALAECMAHQETGFGEAEIKKSVESAYKSKTREFTDEQIKKYQALTTTAKPVAPKPKAAKADRKESTEADPANRPKFIRIKTLLDRRYDFRLNVVANEIEFSEKGENSYRVLNENDLICELLEAGFSGVEAPLIALLKSSFVPEYDPFKEYFESLPPWREGDQDYITQLANFIAAKDQFWFNLQFKKMLVRTVACSLNVIPFNKQCFVLKGEQNDGKSTFIRFLCPPKLSNYITDHIDVNNKDGRMSLCQNFIINLDELSQFPRGDIRKVKALITLDSVKERLPYDRKPTKVVRRASFFGSTNDDEFLVDETGNVRWLIMEIDRHGVNHDKGGPKGYTGTNIDRVYSQAYALLKSGFEFELTKEEIAKSEINNQSYQIVTVEQELIQEHFTPSTEGTDGAEFVTATDIMKAIEADIKTTLNKRNIGRALVILGFEKAQRYYREYGYQKKGYWAKRLQTSDEG